MHLIVWHGIFIRIWYDLIRFWALSNKIMGEKKIQSRRRRFLDGLVNFSFGIFSSEKWPNTQSWFSDELLHKVCTVISNSQSQKCPIKVENDFICNFFALKYVTLASLRIIMWVLWDFCLRWSGNLFTLMTITTSKISNVLKLHTL